MEQILENLLEYGILGMWTISLLVSKYQSDKKHGEQMDKFHEEYTHRIESLENEIEGLRKDIDDKNDKIVEQLIELKHKL
tara:strand:- start:12197 stop:12436 length:240 start_codon:yes stop_codon:yes gene_type:complete